MSRAIVIIGGFSTSSGHYRKMANHLRERCGLPVNVVPITMSEWPAVARQAGWRRLLRHLDDTLTETQSETGCENILIIAHSLGGIVTRLYLSEPPSLGFKANHKQSVDCVLTLGTPHTRGIVRSLTVWSGLSDCLSHARINIPIISCVGEVDYSKRGRVVNRIVQLRYRLHGAGPDEKGDGIIPVKSAIYDPKLVWIIENARHDFRIGHPWYGDPEIVDDWWQRVKNQLNF